MHPTKTHPTKTHPIQATTTNSIKKTGRVATIEDNTLKGGLGSSVIELVNKFNLQNIKVETFGYDDCFVPHGGTEELEKIYKQDVESIAEQLAKS